MKGGGEKKMGRRLCKSKCLLLPVNHDKHWFQGNYCIKRCWIRQHRGMSPAGSNNVMVEILQQDVLKSLYPFSQGDTAAKRILLFCIIFFERHGQLKNVIFPSV